MCCFLHGVSGRMSSSELRDDVVSDGLRVLLGKPKGNQNLGHSFQKSHFDHPLFAGWTPWPVVVVGFDFPVLGRLLEGERAPFPEAPESYCSCLSRNVEARPHTTRGRREPKETHPAKKKRTNHKGQQNAIQRRTGRPPRALATLSGRSKTD